MNKDLKELLLAFNAHGVRYLVVGGYAIGVHAEPRATKELEIFIGADEQNSHAVYSSLAAFGAPLQGFTPGDFNDEQGSTFQIGQPPARIDILQRIDGIHFDEAWEDRVEGLIEGEIPAHVISRKHLIRNKLATGRARDIAVVEVLREAALESSAE